MELGATGTVLLVTLVERSTFADGVVVTVSDGCE